MVHVDVVIFRGHEVFHLSALCLRCELLPQIVEKIIRNLGGSHKSRENSVRFVFYKSLVYTGRNAVNPLRRVYHYLIGLEGYVRRKGIINRLIKGHKEVKLGIEL